MVVTENKNTTSLVGLFLGAANRLRELRTRAAAHNTSNWKALSVSSGQKLTWLDKEQSWLGGKGF